MSPFRSQNQIELVTCLSGSHYLHVDDRDRIMIDENDDFRRKFEATYRCIPNTIETTAGRLQSRKATRDVTFQIPLGKPFILTVEDEPIELQVNACLSKAHYFDYGLKNADEHYRFLVLRVRAYNLGRRLVSVELMDRSEVLVDKGYVYERITHPCFALRPEEFRVDYAVFEILSTVKPVLVTWNDRERNFLIDLHEAQLEKFDYGDPMEYFETDH
jgi:hypothetical protein